MHCLLVTTLLFSFVAFYDRSTTKKLECVFRLALQVKKNLMGKHLYPQIYLKLSYLHSKAQIKLSCFHSRPQNLSKIWLAVSFASVKPMFFGLNLAAGHLGIEAEGFVLAEETPNQLFYGDTAFFLGLEQSFGVLLSFHVSDHPLYFTKVGRKHQFNIHCTR